MKSVAIAIMWMTLAGAAYAQDPPQPLSLGAAVELARANHPAARGARADAAATNAEIAVAESAYLPRMDLLWQTNRATRNNVYGLLLPQLVVPAVSGPVLGATSNSVWNSAGGLLFSWEAVDFGRRAAGVELARAEAGAADARRAATELDLATSAADTYLGVLVADAVAGAARANVDRLTTFATSVRALVDSQLRAGAELSRVEAELAAARNRQIEAERDAELARLTLAEMLGVPGTRFVLDPGPLSQPPATAAALPVDLATHPRAAAADADREAARARGHVLDKSYTPRVEVQSALFGRGVSENIDGTDAGNAFGLHVGNWAVGVSVTFPSLEIFRVRARQRVEEERIKGVAAQYDRTVQALQTQEARSRAFMAAAAQIAANTPAQLRAARDGDAQARARYDAGLTTVLEVAEAQRLLAEAEADSAVANLAVWRAMLAEAALRGTLQPFLDKTAVAPIAPAR